MKLLAYVDALEKLAGIHWDIELIHSSDDEGNSYHQVQFWPEAVYVEELEHYMEDIICEEKKVDWQNYIKVICIN